ncbi:OLC1v1009311C1 [Oldenlandia corymbosa var. corymbosa]|uniref:Glycosyltransferase n=1 Tax=Oldenlandia corymbosa var. corymbosa TaxID=529605 RepID=A0AAV1DR21_OLDCO|nr:OLC1v1009311C1 [Oldenlandia corymbosa var. corymbosa]
MGKELVRKPHAVCIPYPCQSHISAMLKLAKLLHHKGFHITYVHTEYNYNRLLKTRGSDSVKGSPDFNFETIPDGLPPAENDDVTQDVFQLCMSTAKNCHAPFLELLNKLNKKAEAAGDGSSPPVTCIISDAFMSFTLQAAEELGIPNVQSWTLSAFATMCFIHVPHFKERGYVPLKDASYFTNGYMDQSVDWIPGIKSIKLKHVPTVTWTTDPNDPFLAYLLDLMPRTCKGSATIINTFDALEHDVLKQFPTLVDQVYSIGPVHTHAKVVQYGDKDNKVESIKSNLWKEDDGCIEWLNSKEKGSVAYVNFGSITIMTKDQLVEFAWGLANSMQNFLWIIRPDLVPEGAVLPPEFIKATKGRGMLANWCNQELVLNHPSVSVFLTHCGWNSVIESLAGGVPMICWPFFADQQTNSLCVCDYWGVGVEIDSNVDRVALEKVVREMMEGDKGKELKKKALEWKDKADEAVRPGVGSSYTNLNNLIQDVLLKPKHKSYV